MSDSSVHLEEHLTASQAQPGKKPSILPANIGILPDHLQEVSNRLNTLLADEFVLYTKVRRSHWNVTGIHFHDLHLLFEELYEELDVIIDQVAERVRALGHHSIGTLKDFLGMTHLLEEGDTSDSVSLIRDLLNDYETVVRVIREYAEEVDSKFKDSGTEDFLIGIMEIHEKRAWMLRSLLA